LNGILPKNGIIIRPMLYIWRVDVIYFLKKIDEVYIQDPTNIEDIFIRNVIRNKVIPELSRINPSFKKSILNLWHNIYSANDWFNSYLERLIKRDVRFTDRVIIQTKNLKKEHPYVRLGFINKILHRLTGTSNKGQILAIDEIIKNNDGQKEFHLKKNIKAIRSYSNLILTPSKPCSEWEFTIKSAGVYTLPQGQVVELKIIDKGKGDLSLKKLKNKDTAILNADKVSFPLMVRSWKNGDWFIPSGMNGRKKLSDFFIDSKIPEMERRRVPVFLSENNIIWVGGLRIDERVKAQNKTSKILIINIKEKI